MSRSRKGDFNLAEKSVFIVHLRRPKSKCDPRSDPFWELGSFGMTGCHASNLMNPRNAENIEGARLAFAQGGPEGMRLVHLTPRIKVVLHKNKIEATWTPAKMPFRYQGAPILAYNEGLSDFPELEKTLKHGNRSTIEAQFSSLFRSRTTPLQDLLAIELIRVYTEMRNAASRSAIAMIYVDALPWAPTMIDQSRQLVYEELLDAARGKASGAACGSTFKKKRICKKG